MQMVAMAGTRHGAARTSRATIGARGWWSISGNRARWTSQTALARRYAPAENVGSAGLFAMLLIGAAIHGAIGAVVAFGLWVAVQVMSLRDPPDGFVCLRCGCEFSPTDDGRARR